MSAVLTIALIALLAGLLLSFAYRSIPMQPTGLVEKVNKLLPQTQCAQCGYPGCRPYAAAIVEENAEINLCTPGGEHVMREMAELLGRDTLPLAAAPPESRMVAQINEDLCIGCTHCRNACPVDAIIGSQQFMHSIIESECTGCELCVAPCPVDCISMRSAA